MNPLICAATQDVVRLGLHATSSRAILDWTRGGATNYMINAAEGLRCQRYQCMTNPPSSWTHH